MSKTRRFGLGAAASALLLSSVSPAYAGWGLGMGRSWGGGWNTGMSWGGGGGGWGRRHHGDDDTGEVLGGILIGAVLIGAIASASKKSKRAQRDRDYDRQDQGTRDDPRDSSSQRNRGDISTEDQAVDACANAAEGKGGRTASVRDIDRVNRSSDGWDVEGIVEQRDGWRDRAADRHRFTCSVRYGAVDSVYIEDGKIAFAN
jgi:hypothetical protein